MAPPKEEWLIWAQKTKFKVESIMQEVSALKDQISSLQTQATIQQDQISSLQTSNAELADSNKQLQSDNLDLGDRVLCLEQGTIQQDQISSLQTSHAELADSNKQLQSHNLALSERVFRLELGLDQQDEINAIKSQDVHKCEGRIDTMFQEYTSVLNAVTETQNFMEYMLSQASIQRETLKELKTQVRAITAGDKPEALPYGDLGSQDLTRPIITPSRPFRGTSQATTEDEDMHTDLSRTQTQPVSKKTQMLDESMLLTQPTRSTPKPTLAPQRHATILEYVKYGDDRIPQSVMRYEAEMVKAFVKELTNGHVRDTVSNSLNQNGWTWEHARKELLKHGHHGQEGNRRRQIRQYGRNQSGSLF